MVKTTAIQAGWFDDTQNKELPEALRPRPAIEIQAGDLLMTCAGPRSRCGVPTLVRQTRPRLMMSGKMYRFRPSGDLVPEYLEKWLLSPEAQKRIDRMKTGISDSGLNLTQDRFLRLPVPVPPIAEQRRVVEILGDHLSHLGVGDEALQTAASRLAALQRASLDRHFGQHLTTTLGDLVSDISAGKSFGSSNAPAREDEWGIIKVSAMTWGAFDANQNKAVSAERVDPRYEICAGDLLVSRANTSEYVGASVLVRQVRPRLLLSDKSLRVTPKPDVCPEWLWRALQAPSARRQISSLATGTKDSMRNISQASLRAVRLPSVNLDAQEAALRGFSEIETETTRLTQSISRQQARSTRLRRALLAAAFEGKLTGRHTDQEVIEELAEA